MFYTAWTPIRGLYFAGEQEGWTVRGLEGDFCGVLVAVSGGAGGAPLVFQRHWLNPIGQICAKLFPFFTLLHLGN